MTCLTKVILTETIKVYDGYGALRKRFFRTITVHKQCSRDELLLAAMRAFVVSQDSRNFYLLDVYANSEGDRDEEITDPTPIMVFVISVQLNIQFWKNPPQHPHALENF